MVEEASAEQNNEGMAFVHLEEAISQGRGVQKESY
jgi:hypothetical protein